ncbi:flavodoxin family protein [Eubacterium sp. 1001713B170207_170306_E7]|uniref:flavodoxin family protein n=1 Tax=Eubacterium sp. 1001713B170207_170306_E7 TaxID=2787097 RepID=UPI001A9B5E52|nr:flavodoxin family protein [Eubacterium sp. 1001713B170207_170306_E7]
MTELTSMQNIGKEMDKKDQNQGIAKMKIAICYVSIHHGNTKKVVEGIKHGLDVDLFDVAKPGRLDLSDYELIGFASGVFYNNLHKNIEKCITETTFGENQSVFLMATCGVPYRDYTKGARALLKEKNVAVAGSFQCRGYDTFGPFGKIGGIAKKHPNDADIKRALDFVRSLI